MTDDYQYLRDDCKRMLPADYTMMAANRIKLFANYDKMRILESSDLKRPAKRQRHRSTASAANRSRFPNI